MTERLTTLLHDAADAPEPLWLRDIEQRVRRNHRRRTTLAAVVTTVVVAAVVVPLTVVPHHGRSTSLTTATRSVTYLGVTVDVPPGWQVIRVGCLAKQVDVVVLADEQCGTGHGPDIQIFPIAPPALSEVNRERSLGPPKCSGPNLIVDGQPASTTLGCSEVYGRLDFPYLDAGVATDGTGVRALIPRVSVQTASSLEVPASAASLTISSYSPAGVGHLSRVERAATVSAVLGALRTAPQIAVPTRPCLPNGSVFEVAVGQGRSYEVVFGSCMVIVAGNGTVARATPELRAALAAIVGSAPLD